MSIMMFVVILLGVTSTQAQVSALNASAGTDPGNPDVISVADASVDPGDHFRIQISLLNDEELSGATIGIRWGTPDLILDSISFVGTRLEALPPFQRPVTIDNTTLFAGLAGFFVFGPPGIQSGTGAFANFWFTVSPAAADQFIDLDSTFFPPSGDFILVALAGNVSFAPQFSGGRVTVGVPPEPSTIDASPTNFLFNAIENATNPAFQVLNIDNVGLGNLNWTATFSSSWLNVSPTTGVAPSVTQVTANSIGLPVGTYFDTVVITDPNATNSPFEIPVELVVSPPPPTINVSQFTYFFNAIADSTNPPAQTLIIKNTTNGSLNWQASNSESWLTVTPTSGGDSTDVSLSVDIAGLPFGSYKDTIIISDPDATNSPVKVVVNLSVASDLPIISLSPDTIHVVVDLNSPALLAAGDIFDTAVFIISNAGAGSMTYSLSETSSRIFAMTPIAGTAPDSIQVIFKLIGGSPGDVIDSILVSSPEAINSPQYEYIRYHFTFTPANITLSPDTLEFSLFECEQGASFVPQIEIANFNNFGEPAPFSLEFDIDWLTSMQNFGTAPTSIGFIANETGLSVGQYLDSIIVISPISQTNPQYLYVRLTIQTATQAAVIVPNKEVFVIPARENESFQYGPADVLKLNNFHGGCFNWDIQESISWLSHDPPSGQNPASILLIGDGTNLLFGEYDSLFTVTVPEANNSPRTISTTLRVWRLFGDADYNNRINVSDVVYLIEYIFSGGLPPEPAIYVGDVDCTGTVNVSDVTFLIAYIFDYGDTPCGNEGF
ncbi:hypothetical protein JYU19_02040 [bacterium AH-315-J21]|nr:hypothetical protein [bacterium AH-315-J21]